MKTLCLAVATAIAALASPITYTLTTSAGGTLGGAAFGDNNVTFTQVSDTSTVGTCFVNAICPVASTSNTVTIQGIGTFTLTDSTVFFDNPAVDEVGFLDNLSTLLGEDDAAFITYDMVSNLGPIFDGVAAHSGTNIPTSGGLLTFTGNSLDATFQAVTSSSSTPEPGSFVLLLAGVVFLHVWRAKIVRRGYELHESDSHCDCAVAVGASPASGAGSRG